MEDGRNKKYVKFFSCLLFQHLLESVHLRLEVLDEFDLGVLVLHRLVLYHLSARGIPKGADGLVIRTARRRHR